MRLILIWGTAGHTSMCNLMKFRELVISAIYGLTAQRLPATEGQS